MHFFAPAHAQATYSPGVTKGNSVTFGLISVTWRSNSTPPTFIEQLIQTKSIQFTVTSVVTNTVTLNMTTTYKNGTITSNIGTVNVQDGSGQFGIFLLAGGLSAGYPIYQTSQFSIVNYIQETTTGLYAGALRSVNDVSVGGNDTSGGPYSQQIALHWDAQTGFLLEIYEDITYPGQSFALHLKVTSTNVWSPSTSPNFSFDAIPQTLPPVHQGESATFNLVLNSTNGFAGTIHLAPTLLNSTQSNPTLSLSRTSLSLQAGKSNSSILKFSAKGTTPLGLYIFSVNGTSGILAHNIILAVTVAPPDFEITATPPNLTIAEGTTKTSTVTVRSLGNFSGTVNLSTTILFPLTVNLQPTTVTLSATATSANSTLTVSVPSGISPGPYYYVQVQGTSGSLSHSFTVPINVTGPDFQMSASPPIVTLKQGAIAQSTITLTSILGFQGNILLNTYSYGVSSSLDKTQVFLNATTPAKATLTISVPSNAQPGNYFVAVDGNSANFTRSTYVVANVTGPDFRVSVNPSSFTLQEGTNATSTITLTSVLGFHGNVGLAASVYNFNGPTVVVSPGNVTLAANATATSKLAISSSGAVPGYYTIQVMATGGNMTHYGYVNVQVIGPDFSISSSVFSLTVRQGGSATSTITLSGLDNFNGTISLSAAVTGPFPGGLTASINPTSVTLSSSSISAQATLTVTASQTAAMGYYNILLTGTSGKLTHTFYIFVQVVGPDFSIAITPSSLTLQEGTNATSTITLTSTLGFQGPVALSATDYYINGPTAIVSPASVTLASNATATAQLRISTAGTVPGSYYIQVSAASGTLNRYASVYVQVLGPDFSMSNPFQMTLRQGSAASATITLGRIDNFNGTIYLSPSINGPYPGGLTASINPASVTLSSTTTSATANLTITATQTATPGYYAVLVTGSDGRLSHTAYIQVLVTLAPDFLITASSPADFNSGASGSSIITIAPMNGFTGTVTITTSTLPSTGLNPGCPTSLTINSLAGNGTTSVTATCHPTATTPGTYHVNITATGGGITHITSFTSHVGTFKVSTSPSVDFNSGASQQIPVVLSSINSFSGSITLAATSSSTGLIVTCPIYVIIQANANVASACSLSSTTPGTYTVTIVAGGHPGTYSQTTTLVVHVGDFTISASSGSFNSGASGASMRISLTSTYNFAGSVSLSTVTDPATGLNIACPTSPIPLTANGTAIASCTLDSASPGTYQITITGTGTLGSASHGTKSIVHVGDFTVNVNPTDINFGSNGPISVSLTSTNNFAGTISLSATISPTGLAINCPISVDIMANSTVTIPCGTESLSPGTYSVTITGAGSIGTLPHPSSTIVHVGDFTISIESPVNADLGNPNSVIKVDLTSTLNFAGTVVLTPDTSPANGLIVTCPAVTLAANSSSVAYCTLNAVTAGTFLVTIKGSSLPGTGSHSSSGIVQIADFTVTAGDVSPSTIAAGETGSSLIIVATVNGFSETVTLAVSPPSGIDCSFDHTTIQSPGTSTLTCTGTSPGDYKVTVTAIGRSTFHQTHLTFHVTGGPSQAPTSPTMFGLQLPMFYTLIGGIIVGVTVASVTVVVRRRK